HDDPRPGLADDSHLPPRGLYQRAIARPPANLGIDGRAVETSYEGREGLGPTGTDAVGLEGRRAFTVPRAPSADLESGRATSTEIPRSGNIALQPRRAPAQGCGLEPAVEDEVLAASRREQTHLPGECTCEDE